MLFEKYERLFLEAKVREWGWHGDNAKIFMGRMLSGNSRLSNALLGEDLELCNDNGDLILNKVAETLSTNIMGVLRKAGCPRGNWRVAQRWLQEEIFPKWVKPWAWQELWLLTNPNPGIEIKILDPLLRANPDIPPEYLPRQIPLGANVTYQIPMAAGESLILLEKDGNGDIFCLQPSRYPKHKVGEPVATSEVIAIVSPEQPEVEWWNDAATDKGFLPIQTQQIESLMKWVGQEQNNCLLWQFEVEIVEPKSEAVAVNDQGELRCCLCIKLP